MATTAHDRGAVLAALRRDAAMIFQDHDNALNPRLTVGQALAEVLAVRPEGGADRHPSAGR